MACPSLKLHVLRSLTRLLLWLAGAIVLLVCVHQFVLPLVALIFPVLESSFYDLGVYGLYPTDGYVTFPLRAPRANLVRWDKRCETGNVLLTPNGASVTHPGPMILDSRGGLVWTSDKFGVTANLKMQKYRGEDVLTFWAGEKAETSGKGEYYILNSAYETIHVVNAVGENIYGDLHEFTITSNDTALMTVYNTTTTDLTAMGRPKEGWIFDSIFQEIDLVSGELLFEWKASEHVLAAESYMTNPFAGYKDDTPFDFYHVNSIDKDRAGNYLISARHFHSISCISPSGEILWILGGKHNEFSDLSGGRATDFKWQHTARWLSEEDGTIVLFDNGKGGTLHVDAAHSRGMIVQLDIPNRTAKLVESYTSKQGILSASQGSLQVLPGSNQAFIGWGSAAAYSEYTYDGTLLCETHLGASLFYWWERMKSYRTSKVTAWHGQPSSPPAAAIAGDEIYVSWNGATDVAFWTLEGSRTVDASGARRGAEHDFETIESIPKAGFESMFYLPDKSGNGEPFLRYRIAALDSDETHIRYSNIVAFKPHGSNTVLILTFLVFVIVGFAVGARMFLKRSSKSSTSILPTWAKGPRLKWSSMKRSMELQNLIGGREQ